MIGSIFPIMIVLIVRCLADSHLSLVVVCLFSRRRAWMSGRMAEFGIRKSKPILVGILWRNPGFPFSFGEL
jgi:hypothetical protein